MAYANGQLPSGALISIPGGRLARGGPGESWLAGPAKAGLMPTGDQSSYRDYAGQLYFWNLYQSGRGNLAAYPGTSNHGNGSAMDLREQWMRAWIDAHGAKYGWRKVEAMSEWWHVNFVGGWDGSGYFPVIKQGMKGKRVKGLQKMLRFAGGQLDKPKPFRYWPKGVRYSGNFGPITKRRVKRFQRDHGLEDDGVVGEATYRKLRRITKRGMKKKK